MKWKSYKNPPAGGERPGDKGESKLLDGAPRKKQSPILVALNHVWELNTAAGILIAHTKNEELKNLLKKVQNHLFVVQADLAATHKSDSATLKLDFDKTRWLEEYIEKTTPTLPDITHFVLPGGSYDASMLDWLGALTRKAESIVYAAREQENINPAIGHYINRLSDFFYILARKTNYEAGVQESKPDYA